MLLVMLHSYQSLNSWMGSGILSLTNEAGPSGGKCSAVDLKVTAAESLPTIPTNSPNHDRNHAKSRARTMSAAPTPMDWTKAVATPISKKTLMAHGGMRVRSHFSHYRPQFHHKRCSLSSAV